MNLGNPYSYVGNNPMTYTDPLGLWTSDPDDIDALLDAGNVRAGSFVPRTIADSALGQDINSFIGGIVCFTNDPFASQNLDKIQLGLAGLGMTPVFGAIPDSVDFGVNVLRRRWGDATVSAIAIVPFAGQLGRSAELGHGISKIPDINLSKFADAGTVASKKPLSRRAAFREAKEKGGIPRSQQPTKTYTERLTDQPGNVQSRVYEYKRSDGSVVTVREHSLGHTQGNHPSHFNTEVRPLDRGPRQPLQGGADSHTYFGN